MSKSRGGIAKDRADHVMEQLSGLGGVRRIPMMAGCIFYIHDRVFGGIYESCDLMIKIIEPSRKYMPNSVPEPPLEGQGHASLHDPGGQGTVAGDGREDARRPAGAQASKAANRLMQYVFLR